MREPSMRETELSMRETEAAEHKRVLSTRES